MLPGPVGRQLLHICVVCSCQDLSAFPAVPGRGDEGRSWQQALCPAAPPCSSSLLFAEMDGAGERVDQGGGEEVRGGQVESHLPQVPLPEPHRSHDQGSLADHEETGDAVKFGSLSFSVFFGPQFVFWKLHQRAVCASVRSLSENKTMTEMNPGTVFQLWISVLWVAGAVQPLNINLEPPGLRFPCPPDHCSC